MPLIFRIKTAEYSAPRKELSSSNCRPPHPASASNGRISFPRLRNSDASVNGSRFCRFGSIIPIHSISNARNSDAQLTHGVGLPSGFNNKSSTPLLSAYHLSRLPLRIWTTPERDISASVFCTVRGEYPVCLAASAGWISSAAANRQNSSQTTSQSRISSKSRASYRPTVKENSNKDSGSTTRRSSIVVCPGTPRAVHWRQRRSSRRSRMYALNSRNKVPIAKLLRAHDALPDLLDAGRAFR